MNGMEQMENKKPSFKYNHNILQVQPPRNT